MNHGCSGCAPLPLNDVNYTASKAIRLLLRSGSTMKFIDVRIHQNMRIQELHPPYRPPYRSSAEGFHLRAKTNIIG